MEFGENEDKTKNKKQKTKTIPKKTNKKKKLKKQQTNKKCETMTLISDDRYIIIHKSFQNYNIELINSFSMP